MSDNSCDSVDVAPHINHRDAGQRMQLKARRKRKWWSLGIYRNREE